MRFPPFAACCFALGLALPPAAAAQTAEMADNMAARASPAEAALLADINRFRAGRHLGRLHFDAKLMAAARRQAEDNAARGLLDHVGGDGSRVGARVRQAGYHYSVVAENLAAGSGSAAATLALWEHSPHHLKNLLIAEARDAGIAHVVAKAGAPGGFGDYWVLVVAAPLAR